MLSNEVKNINVSSEQIREVWRLEYQEGNYEEAAKLYRKQADSSNDIVRLSSYLDLSRCLAKLKRFDEAVIACKKAAFSDLQENADTEVLNVIGNARLQLLSLIGGKDQYKNLYADTFSKLASMIFSVNKAGSMLATDNNMFLTERVFQILQENHHLKDENQEAIEQFSKLKAVEEYSAAFCENKPNVDIFYEDHELGFRKHQVDGERVYSLRQKGEKAGFLFLFTAENLSKALFDFEKRFGDDVAFWISDENGAYVWGEKDPEGECFLIISLKNALGKGWKASLHFIGENLFDKAANRQRAIYTWTGILVVLLILSSGAIAAKVIGRQIKLNRLKNDFIATVTHELKTPLSSMRVLVDTLLEGNYNDQQQATEYLYLISKENARLSHLIDNFLTFSRMERSKQAFDMAKTDPTEIAKSAADAVQTKFDQENCEFTVTIEENLTPVFADKDAMVTVLVNLLDNAYKYSYDEKQIQLEVFSKEDFICFAVKDNGIGMTSRQIKKVFDRFYQADSSLSRRTEGTGLGLSIVKFIIDAHNGRIDVESKKGEQSTFIVKLPSFK